MDTLTLYRDDGPLARTLAPLLRPLALAPAAAATTGTLALLIGLAADGAATGWPTATGWVVHLVLGAVGLHRPPQPRLGWLVPAVLRTAEYVFVIWLGWRAGGVALPIVYGLLFAVAYHHYDVVYRVRHQDAPPAWVAIAGLGWDGRSGLLLAAAAAGIFVPVAGALAIVGVVLFVSESVTSWARPSSGPTGVVGS